MKYDDLYWIEGLVQKSLHPHYLPKPTPQEILHQVQNFLDQTCEILFQISQTYNDLIASHQPHGKVKIFKLNDPQKGMMLLKGREKLLISSNATSVFARIVEISSFQEKLIHTFHFEMQIFPEGTLGWVCLEDQNRVNPELVSKTYLSPFLSLGSKAYRLETADD